MGSDHESAMVHDRRCRQIAKPAWVGRVSQSHNSAARPEGRPRGSGEKGREGEGEEKQGGENSVSKQDARQPYSPHVKGRCLFNHDVLCCDCACPRTHFTSTEVAS